MKRDCPDCKAENKPKCIQTLTVAKMIDEIMERSYDALMSGAMDKEELDVLETFVAQLKSDLKLDCADNGNYQDVKEDASGKY
jgi:hypothetical protein